MQPRAFDRTYSLSPIPELRGGVVKFLVLDHLTQHVLQDAAVAEVVSLTRGVDADVGIKLDGLARLLGSGDVDGLRDLSLIHI